MGPTKFRKVRVYQPRKFVEEFSTVPSVLEEGDLIYCICIIHTHSWRSQVNLHVIRAEQHSNRGIKKVTNKKINGIKVEVKRMLMDVRYRQSLSRGTIWETLPGILIRIIRVTSRSRAIYCPD